MERFNLTLWNIGGFPLTIHWTWFVFMGFAALSGPQMMLLWLAMFVLVTLHEYGHAYAAIYRGFNCHSITIWPLGGIAWLDLSGKKPYTPKDEFLVTCAGPMVNFVLGLLVLPACYLLPESYASFAMLFVALNLVLFVFNMLPAFPMDGGKILRSGLCLLGFQHDRATIFSCHVSRLMVILFVIAGFTWGNVGLLIGAVFIFIFNELELSIVYIMRKRATFRTDLAELTKNDEVLVCDELKLLYYVNRLETLALRQQFHRQYSRLWITAEPCEESDAQ